MLIELLFATIDLWVFFIIAMKVAEGKKSIKEMNIFQKVFISIFIYKDMLYNYTWGSLLFLEFANKDRKLLTARLKHIIFSGEYYIDGWRWKLALFICQYMIEPWDFNHCSLSRLK